MNIEEIYKILLKEYGEQGWWPVTQENEIIPVYRKDNYNLTEKQMLEICLGAILTQNTSWNNVEKVIINLNKEKLIEVNKLNEIRINELALLIKSAGYFNQKAKTIKNFMKFIKKYNNLKEMFKDEEIRNKLLEIKGIGNETTDSILLYAGQLKYFVIDTYTKRIFSRIGIVSRDVEYLELQKIFHDNLKNNPLLFNEYHALIVEHAKIYCKKKPKCEKCILNNNCNKII